MSSAHYIKVNLTLVSSPNTGAALLLEIRNFKLRFLVCMYGVQRKKISYNIYIYIAHLYEYNIRTFILPVC